MSSSTIKAINVKNTGDKPLKVKKQRICEDDEDYKQVPHVVKEITPEDDDDHEEHDEDEDDDEEDEDEDDEDDDDDDEEEEDEDDVSFTTTEILQNDPLYFVLSKIFLTQDKEQTNVATLLQQIVNKLDVLIETSSKTSKLSF